MRRIPIDPPRHHARALASLLAPALAACLTTTDAGAQTAPAAKPATAPSAPAAGASYVSREKLMLFVEFDGIDAHEDAWRKTAAYKMLVDTPLGTMLEDLGVPLFDRAASWLPNRKINGSDAVAIIKHVARKGFTLAYNVDPAAPRGVRGVLVLRGAAGGKESKAAFSRLVGSFMDPAAKARIDRKESRVLVVVSPAQADPKVPDRGWAWWPEPGKDDLLIGLFQPSDADAVLATLDGKTPSAVGYEPIEALNQADAGLSPVLKAYYDPSLRPSTPRAPSLPMGDSGVKRIEYRWGFQDEALVGVTRIVAPKPRSGALAFLNEPVFSAKKLLPIPDGVEYFASASLKPEQWAAMVSGLMSSGSAKAQYDSLVESVRTRSRMDFEKDLLGKLGPRVLVYMAPSTSAAVVDEPHAPNLADPAAVLGALGPRMPKPVLVAEVSDPARFSRALDAVMLEVNRQIKSAAAAQAADAVKAEAANPGRNGLTAPGEGVDGGSRDRRREEPAFPEFRLLPVSGSESNRTYMLNVPTSSPVKLPAGIKPTVRLEGGFLAVSPSPEAARAAVDSLRRKTWTPPAEVGQALANVPDSSVLLLYGDLREATSAVLASLPGTLQTGINTAIAASERLMNGQSAAPAAGTGGGRGFQQIPGLSTGSGPVGEMQPGGPGNPGQPGGASAPMIQLRIDPSHLPKADELKALMFPSHASVSVDDESIRIVTRVAFPDATALLGARGVLPAALAPAIAAARNAAKAAEAPAGAQQGTAGQPGAPGPPGDSAPGPGAPGGLRDR